MKQPLRPPARRRPRAGIARRFCVVTATGLLAAATAGAASPADAQPGPSGRAAVAADEIDITALLSLIEPDEAQLRAFCREIQQRLQSQYVLNLASLRELATLLVPLLESDPHTRPYAAWLRARLDYLLVADQLRASIPPPADVPPRAPSAPLAPTPEQERRAWHKHLDAKPAPPRAADYVSRFKPVFAAERVPAELVWLAEVESGFDPHALSPVGAAGLYQLMPATARWLGLELSPEDQRYDPDKNAHAAARYLRYLHDKFGDWPLTLAAYNAGEGRVRRLLESQRARRFDEIAPHLPAETQMYVPKVEATVFRREGVRLAELQLPDAAP
jgi:membrane-bound lytic murein transglycosylase D